MSLQRLARDWVLFLVLAPTLPLLAQTSAQVGTQSPTVSVEQLVCLPVSEHAVVRALVTNEVPGTEVRVYFRRLHEEVEDFYYLEMEPAGGGNYWAALPKPADEELERIDLERRRADQEQTPDEQRTGQDEKDYPWGAWWKRKEASNDRDPNDDLDPKVIRERAWIGKVESRHWMDDLDLQALERWLARLRYEPAEYYAAAVDADGRVLGRSMTRVVEVTNDCKVELTEREEGFAHNLTVGETAPWQKEGERVFHWLCDGIVSRIDSLDILRADDVCRACVIAWWKKKEFLIPLGTGLVGVGILIHNDDEPSPSPSRP